MDKACAENRGVKIQQNENEKQKTLTDEGNPTRSATSRKLSQKA